MRIEDRSAAETAVSGLGRTQEGSRAARIEGGATSPEISESGVWDQLNLSGAAGRIRSALDTLAGAQSARVEQLTAEVQSGRYNVDSMRLSRAMLAGVTSAS